MSDDKTIAAAVNAAPGPEAGGNRGADQNRDSGVGRTLGNLAGGMLGIGGGGNLGSAASKLNPFGHKKKDGGKDAVQSTLMEDGVEAKVVHGQSSMAGAVALVVTAQQTSLGLDLNRDGRAETIVTATTDGKLTVGNVDKGTHVTMNDPAGLAGLIDSSGRGAVVPGAKIDFDNLAHEASSAMQLTPAATPKAAPATKPKGRG